MLIGQDISKWNSNVDVNAGDFTIIKVTEGQSYSDPKAKDYVQQLNETQLVGCYHFIRADVKGNDAWMEADNFVRKVISLKLMYKSMLIVDYEAKSVGHEDYLLKFLEGVKIMTGIKCVVYCSASQAKKLKKVKAQGYELWVAHYNVKNPGIGCWDKYLMWQFTSCPWDFDVFNGNEADWVKRTKKST